MTFLSKDLIQKGKIFLLIFVLCSTLVILFVKNDSEKKVEDEILTSPKKILVSKIKIEKKPEIFEFSGYLDAKEIVNVNTQTDGRIQEILVSQGEAVQKDDVIFILDEQEKRAEFIKAQQYLLQKINELKSNEKLFKEKIIPKTRYDESLTSHKDALANLEIAKKNLEFAKIKAPISGYIDKINVKLGDYIKTSSNLAIAKIFSDKDFIVNIFIPQNNIYSIKKNQIAKLKIGSDNKNKILKTGHIEFISNLADQLTKTYYTEILIDKDVKDNQDDTNNNKDLIKSIGSSVDVRIEGDLKNAINLLDSAVFLNDNGDLVIKVLDSEGLIKVIPVRAIDNINTDERSWFALLPDKKNLDKKIISEDGFLRVVVRGGGFLQNNEKVENVEILESE